MLTMKQLSGASTENQADIRAVAAIEGIIQAQDAWDYQVLSDLLAQPSISLLVVTRADDNKVVVVGYCLYQVVFEQAEILRIGTHLEYQRQGIASQLFIRLNKQLQQQQAESLLLEVRADNGAAIALYQQQGFKVIHQRQGYYQQPAIDALIMQLQL